ncbi:MAG: lon, partial [Herminiimonas sp.]|nr:lon [Herminiimonas sp.]
NKLEIVPVRWIDKVLEIALERHPVPLTEDEVAQAAATKPSEKPEPTLVKH